MKHILKWIYKIVSNESNKYRPIKEGESKAITYSCRVPIGKDKFNNIICQVTEWNNGEGFDVSIVSENKERLFSLNADEITLLLACLNDFDYFCND